MVWVFLVLVLVLVVSALAVAVVAYGRAPLPNDPSAPPGASHEHDPRSDRRT
jgi:hypothetical protein